MTPEAIWYRGHPLSYLLLPLSWLYCAAVRMRRGAYRRGWLRSRRLAAPVIIVGNLTVGGTGKTPLVVWLTDALGRLGYRPGIVTRGYGGAAGSAELREVTPVSDPLEVGDEAVLLARRSGRPVAVGRDRVRAAGTLVEQHRCDIIVADDGLQHYRLQRDIEILVVDAERGFGNGRCIPAGPLREPIEAGLARADALVTIGDDAAQQRFATPLPPRLPRLRARLDPLQTGMDWAGQPFLAFAGIAHPE
ncbi:MAG: tetraacyldisaccharide 4'-kinase, partial [Chromatiaceae bacterium]